MMQTDRVQNEIPQYQKKRAAENNNTERNRQSYIYRIFLKSIAH